LCFKEGIQSEAGTSNTDQIYNLYKNTVIQNLLHPTPVTVVKPVTISSSTTSMKKIEEIEPEPEIERLSPKQQNLPIRKD